MGEQLKATINTTLKDKLHHLSVDITQDETSSLDGILQRTQFGTEDKLPSPRNSSSHLQRLGSVARHHELTPVTRNVSYIDAYPFANKVSPDDKETPALPDQIQLSSNNGGAIPLKFRILPAFPNIPLGDRSKSLVNLCAIGNNDEEEDDESFDPQIIQIPSRDACDSFNSLQHLLKRSKGNPTGPIKNGNVLTPYQPSRHDEEDVGALDTNDLSAILIQKNPIILGERQFSIPSIHMANNLGGGSITTLETLEDDLLKDDESWSTRESSSLNLSDDSIDPFLLPGLKFTASNQQPLVIVEGGELLLGDLPQLGGDTSVHAVNNNDRKRQRSARDQSAYEWLRTMEGGSANIAEAASSKFLMREARSFGRQQSSPGEIN